MSLSEPWLREHIWPRFSSVLARHGIYLANHSLGRPLDQMADDVAEFAESWYREMDEAWDRWSAEQRRFTGNVERLIGAPPESVTQRDSAGQGLRAVLNSFPAGQPIRVVTTALEFDSLDFILRTYVEAGLAEVTFVEPIPTVPVPVVDVEAVIRAVTPETDLVVVSMVYFGTGQVFPSLTELIQVAHQNGALVLVDLYHAAGALPVNVQALGADFAVGGSYKYLRGGPGASWLYVSPAAQARKTLDTGWFAKADTFHYERPKEPVRKAGILGWQESTPPVIATFQARSGLELALELGVEALRAYNLASQARLRHCLREAGVNVFEPSDPHGFGAFTLVPSSQAKETVARLRQSGVTVDARGSLIRLCPDILNSDEDLVSAARAFGEAKSDVATG